MKRIFVASTAFLLALTAVFQTGCSGSSPKLASPYSTSIETYTDTIADYTGYALNIAEKIGACKENEKLGFRTAGSQAETNAAEIILQEMKSIGLTGVTKETFSVDTWSFQKGQLSYKSASGTSRFFDIASYQFEFETPGVKHYELVFASSTDVNALSKLNPKGKFILTDSDPENLSYISEQARLLGAAGIITAGSGESDVITLDNQQVSLPVLSIAPKDASYLKEEIRAANYVAPVKKKDSATYTTDKSITIGLEVVSRVAAGGTSANVVGTIPGVHSNEMVLIASSYDGYFDGFSNSSAVGMMLAMAKSLVSNGYTPDKTLVFVAQGADKWGLSGKLYDWGQGGYSQLFAADMHPDWAKKTTAVLYIEAPAFDMGDQYTLRTSYELSTFVAEAVRSITSDVYPKGISVVSPRSSKGGDFTYSLSGIPSIGADLSSPGYRAIADSSLDNSSHCSKDALAFAMELYGTLLMRLDHTAVSPIDLTTGLAALKTSLNTAAMNTAGIKTDKLNAAIEQASWEAGRLKQLIWQQNENYFNALEDQSASKTSKFYEDTRQLYTDSLSLYKRVQSLLTMVDINGEIIFPHQRFQANVNYLAEAIAALQKGNAQTALSTIAKIDANRLYIYYQDEVYDYFDGLIATQTKTKSKWSMNVIEDVLDLGKVVNSLQTKSSEKNLTAADLASEISNLQSAFKQESSLLAEKVEAIMVGIGILADETAKIVGDKIAEPTSSSVSAAVSLSAAEGSATSETAD